MPAVSYTLNQRVLLQLPQTGKDDHGQPLTGFVNLVQDGDGMLWANVAFPGGLETIRNGAVSATTMASIRIRMRDDLTTALRAVHDGVAFNVHAILPHANRAFVDLVCEAVK